MNKIISGILAVSIYLGVIFLILLYYNIYKIKSKNYVEKNSNRVTVTLVNSDKTVFNRSSKISIPRKPTPKHRNRHHILKSPSPKHIIKSKTPYKKEILRRERIVDKKRDVKRVDKIKEKVLAKKREAERIAKAKEDARQKALAKKKELERIARAKEEARKKALAKKKEAERLARIKAERERKRRLRERAKSLFSSIKTSPEDSTRREERRRNNIRHQSSIADNIRDTYLSGMVGKENRERGVVSGYIAKVRNQLSNWNAQSEYRGQSATIKIIIMNSGHFRYSVRHSTSGALTRGLKRFLDQLNRIGLGIHNKSTPYIIEVTFRAK